MDFLKNAFLWFFFIIKSNFDDGKVRFFSDELEDMKMHDRSAGITLYTVSGRHKFWMEISQFSEMSVNLLSQVEWCQNSS